MNFLKRFTILIISALIFTFSVSTVCAASSPDQSVLSAADDKYEPLYTISSDNDDNYANLLNAEKKSKNYELFYTQTTFLALIAGYLILLKVKGIDHSQKMHGRRLYKK